MQSQELLRKTFPVTMLSKLLNIIIVSVAPLDDQQSHSFLECRNLVVNLILHGIIIIVFGNQKNKPGQQWYSYNR